MTLREAICDNIFARGLLERCVGEAPKFQNPVINAFYEWQTLLTGVFALIGAYLLWVQIRDQQKQSLLARDQVTLERSRENLTARIGLPHALADLNRYWKACLEAWEREDADGRPKPPPTHALRTVMASAVLVDDETFVSMQELTINAQAFESRIDQPKGERAINFYETMVVDIARLSYLTNRLYDFGRRRAERVSYVPPTREQLEGELGRDLRIYTSDNEIAVRIQKAMDQEFGKRRNGRDVPNGTDG
ncbi:hypothetical protein D3227_34805 [Mesorhizobium waimense]|uniref:DUF4760 domain-containing protein n=1 Tax=Mesorhizobium waimense TaxID=1300307 RepID=A0A3A5K109_9HYPH|nr:hypothetical protein [Mesorhizobium waimense]RJT28153.1 hypothetical protein D3227_34805 [Mesorhizobium waimense]